MKLLLVSVFYRGRLRSAFVRMKPDSDGRYRIYDQLWRLLCPDYRDGTTLSWG